MEKIMKASLKAAVELENASKTQETTFISNGNVYFYANQGCYHKDDAPPRSITELLHMLKLPLSHSLIRAGIVLNSKTIRLFPREITELLLLYDICIGDWNNLICYCDIAEQPVYYSKTCCVDDQLDLPLVFTGSPVSSVSYNSTLLGGLGIVELPVSTQTVAMELSILSKLDCHFNSTFY